MACNKPRRTSGGSKKFVVKACKNGKEKIIRFGDPNMKIKRATPRDVSLLGLGINVLQPKINLQQDIGHVKSGNVMAARKCLIKRNLIQQVVRNFS